ncbi:MAG: prolyl oligopeptidase family serine peptidase [Deltaproteobacteria bacterium]|nr:prolyl oligopeptidase family serine peptidase [Deltaproteobacteria bacterium]
MSIMRMSVIDFFATALMVLATAGCTPTTAEQQCPMDVVPLPENSRPEETDWPLPLPAGLTLHTFDQGTPRCGPIRRRYFQFVPASLPAGSGAPVVMALHGSEGNAESFEGFYSHGRFVDLATQNGFIAVYGNAAPGPRSSTDPHILNAHTWRTSIDDDGQVDDVAYLELVLNDMKSRGVISGDNDIYLVGLSNGGGMVLTAAAKRPDMFKGIASFMPFVGWEPFIVPDLTGTGLDRIIIGISEHDPVLNAVYSEHLNCPEPSGCAKYDDILSSLPADFAKAMGLPMDVIGNPTVVQLPNVVNEGADYAGDNPVALRTRNSTATQLDMRAGDGSGRLRLLKFVQGGHLWPSSIGDSDDGLNESFGFRNQDIDAADAVWDFFKEN